MYGARARASVYAKSGCVMEKMIAETSATRLAVVHLFCSYQAYIGFETIVVSVLKQNYFSLRLVVSVQKTF